MNAFAFKCCADELKYITTPCVFILQAKDGRKGDASGRRNTEQSPAQTVKDSRNPEEIRKQRVCPLKVLAVPDLMANW